jgi:fibronectin-binding autotransporter adhesin
MKPRFFSPAASSLRKCFHSNARQAAAVFATIISISASAPLEALTLTWDASGIATTAPTDGAGTWDTSAANWNNGSGDVAWPNTNADIAVFGSLNGAAGTVSVGSVTANGINFNAPTSGNYELSSGTITLDGTTPTITSRASATISAVIAGSAGLKVSGSTAAVLTLTGTNTYTGTTTVNGGTLNLGGSTANGSIDSASTLSLNGGTLSYTRSGNTTQTFASTSVDPGASAIRVVAGDTLALGAITKNVGGTVDFSTTGTTTTSLANTNGILGGWATINNTGVGNLNGDWVSNDGSGNIVTYTGYSNVTGAATTGVGPAALNWRTTGNTSIAASTTINSLTMQNDFSVASGATLTINSGGLMLRGQQRWMLNNNAGTTAGTGRITSGLSTGELFLHVPKSDATNWTIWPVIAEGAVPTQLIKDGPGLVYLENNNTFTGGTTVNGGTLRLEHAVGNVGTGVLRGTLTINQAGTVIASGANANTLGYTAGQYVNVMNVNGGLFNSIVAGDQGYAITYNLRGGTIQSNSGVSSNTTTQLLVFGGSSAVNVLASDTTSTLGGRAALRDNLTVFNVADGSASTDLLVSAAVTSANNSGAFGFTKTGLGRMVLSGTNTHTGTAGSTYTVSSGIIQLTGSIAGSSLSIGSTGGAAAAMYQAGAVTTGGGGLRIGQAPGAFGYYKLSSGALTLLAGGEVDPGGSAGGAGTFGQFDMVGGSVGGGDYLLPNRGAAGSSSVTNISAGTFTIPSTVVDGNFNGLAANWQNAGAAQTAVITLSGTGQFLSPTVRVKLNEGSSFNGVTGNAANVTALNLASGGLLQTLGFLNGTSPNVSLNFSGGTLKAGSAANAAFLPNNLGSVNVYGGTSTIDNNGQAIAIAQPFIAATGEGVTSVPVTAAGSGYITPPQVTFTGGTVTGGNGSAATGYATIDPANGKLTGIVITNPGTYSDITGLGVSINGGGGTGASLGSITTATNTSGGMNFSGSGTTTLSSINTYTGATAVNGGTLRLTGTADINASSDITVNGAAAKLVQLSSTQVTPVVSLTQGTVDGTGTINTLNVASAAGNILTAGNGGVGTLTVGSLSFSGAATVNLGLNGISVDTSIASTNLSTNAAGTVTLNVTNSGLWTNGTYPLITYGGGGVGGAGFGQFALSAPLGLGGRQSASLTDTGTAVALTIAGDSPVWTGLTSGEWTTTTIGGSQNWELITSQTGTDFQTSDVVLFDDTVGAGITSITINDSSVSPISTVFNNSSVIYTLGGSNGINTGTLAKNGTSELVINNSNTFAGGTTLNAGTLSLNNASAIGTGPLVINGGTIDNSSGSPKTLSTDNPQTWNGNFAFAGSNELNLGLGAVTLSSTPTITTNGSALLTVGGVISGSGLGVTKAGNGTLTLSGANAYTGATTVNGGTLNLTGSAALTGGLFVSGGGTLNLNGTLGTSTVANTFIVGQAAGNGVLNIPTGVTLTRSNLFLGDAAGVTGAVYQSGGAVTLTQGGGADNLRIGSAATGHGYYNLSGGTLTANEIGVGGLANDTSGVMDVTAGTATSNGWLVVGRGGAKSSGSLNVTGGTVNFGSTAANPLAINWAGTSGASSVVNVGGGAGAAAINGANATVAGRGLNLALGNVAGTLGVANLLTNGTLTVSEVVSGNANPTALLNFNGGTLAATAASRGVAFMPGTNIDGVYVYGNGGTIQNNGTNITIGAALLAPTVGSGNGVNGIDSFTGGAGYIGAPLVQIVNDPGDTTGFGATAVATVSGGVVTGITITNPGVGYTATPTFVLTGGGATTAATVTGTAPTPNTSGGMTFLGSGRTTLTGANLYTGGTVVNGGTLQITDDAQLGAVPASPEVNVTLNGATLYNIDSTPVTHANRTISLGIGGGYLQAGWAPKSLTVNGLITGVGGLAINWDGGALVLNAANDYVGNTTIGDTGPSYWANAAANPTLRIGIDNALPFGPGKGNVVFGTSANANIPTLDLNSRNLQVNGLTGAANAVIDNSAGTGDYVLTVGNNDQTSTFAGSIRNTSGKVGLTKTGTGTLTLSGASSYTGNTTINNGTLIANLPNNTLNPVTSALGNNQVAHTVTVNNGATLRFNSGDTLGGNASTLATTLVINQGGTVTNGGVVFNRLGSVTLNGGTLTSTSGAAAGYQTYSFDAAAVVTVGGSSASTIATNGTFNGIHLNTNTVFDVADATSSVDTDLTVSSPLIDRNLSEGGAGALTKNGAGTMTLTGINTYSGNTTVNAGKLELADGAGMRFVLGATSGTNNTLTGAGSVTLDGDFSIDTTAADGLGSGSWTLENVGSLTGAYGSTFSVVGFTDAGDNKWTKANGAKTYTFDETTGILTLTQPGYASWIDGFFPSETNPAIIGAGADPDFDGIANAVEMVIGGDPKLGMDTALLPTLELVTDPVGSPAIPAGDYLLFTYRRTDLAVTGGVTTDCETDTDLAGTWTSSTGAPGVVIQVDDNFTFTPAAAADTDRVRVYIPREADTTLFGRLKVVVP